MNDLDESQIRFQRKARKSTILLIEDDKDHCLLIQTVLKRCMPEVNLRTVATGEEAQAWLEACIKTQTPLPRLILLDVYLPKKEDGMSILQRLKKPTSPFGLIPVTLLSHSGKSDDIQAGYQLGANSYIVKPTDHPQWIAYFESLRQYWLYTVTPPFD